MKKKFKLPSGNIFIVVIGLILVFCTVISAQRTNMNIGLVQSHRYDYDGACLISPPGSSIESPRLFHTNDFLSYKIHQMSQMMLDSSSTKSKSVLLDGTDWNNAGGNPERNGLSQTKGPLSADLLWFGGRPSLISWLPVTEDDRLFVIRQAGWPGAAHDSPVVAMDLLTGQELWSVEIPYHTNDWTTWIGGVKNGQVYASRSGNGASVQDNLYALDAETGDTLWVSTELIDAGPYDGVVFAPDGDPMIASFTDIWRFNSQDGSLVWHANRVGSVSSSCGGALFQDRFYIADAAPGGHIIVSYDLETGTRLYESLVMPGFTLQNTPFIGPDGTVYLSRTQNNPVTDFFYAFTDTGASFVEKWHVACAWTTFSEFATSRDGSVYCLLPGPRIGMLDANTGGILAQSDVLDDPDSYLSPHFAVDAVGTVYFSNGGFADGLVSVFTSDLLPVWNTTISNINIGGPSLGHNGVLLLCGTGTNIRAYRTAQPLLSVNITDVFPRVAASISNDGETVATNLIWNISVSGGVLGRINQWSSDHISELDSMQQVNVSLSRMIFGLGKITITVAASCDEGITASKTEEGFVFLFFVSRGLIIF